MTSRELEINQIEYCQSQFSGHDNPEAAITGLENPIEGKKMRLNSIRTQ